MNTFNLNDIINFGIKRFPYNIDRESIIDKLLNIPTETNDPSIISLKGDYWEFVVEDIREEAQKLLTSTRF